MTTNSIPRIFIWDFPLRLFHWALAISAIGAYSCVKLAGVDEGWISDLNFHWMDWHFFFGYAVLTLILFRVIWGFCGSYYARFTQFVKGPLTIIRYLKGTYQNFGHNPLGALSAIAMLFFFGMQAVSGLFIEDTDGLGEGGPLADLNSNVSEVLTSFHFTNPTILVILFAFHILAILYYILVKRKNLVRPMITGYVNSNQDCATAVAFVEKGPKLSFKAFIIFIVCLGVVYWIVNYAATVIGN